MYFEIISEYLLSFCSVTLVLVRFEVISTIVTQRVQFTVTSTFSLNQAKIFFSLGMSQYLISSQFGWIWVRVDALRRTFLVYGYLLKVCIFWDVENQPLRSQRPKERDRSRWCLLLEVCYACFVIK